MPTRVICPQQQHPDPRPRRMVILLTANAVGLYALAHPEIAIPGGVTITLLAALYQYIR